MNEVNRILVEILMKQSREQIISSAIMLINSRFEKRINDMELYARVFYASILSSYTRANSLGSNVGIFLPELEAITKALYAMSRKRSSKQGSFETSKAFEIARSLSLSYKVPIVLQGNTLNYKLKFTINHPVLIALEQGDVSWENMEKNKIIKILQAALMTLKEKNRKIRRSSIGDEIKRAITQLNSGGFKIIRNKRPYMKIVVKNLVKEKDFINILIK